MTTNFNAEKIDSYIHQLIFEYAGAINKKWLSFENVMKIITFVMTYKTLYMNLSIFFSYLTIDVHILFS